MELSDKCVLLVADLCWEDVSSLLAPFELRLALVPEGEAIPGSYWGESEAGLLGDVLHVRPDTPIHSVLHEASHFACMSGARRSSLEKDAGGDELEESAVCYFQILLASCLTGVGRDRMFEDMDLWGYSFRLGSTRAWFESDSEDARLWLREHGLVDERGEPCFRVRG
jgi:hypothetical protein